MKKSDRSLSFALILAGVTIAVAVSAWLFYLSLEKSSFDGYMNGVAETNDRLAQTMAMGLASDAKNEDDAVRILSDFPEDGITYWSLYDTDSLIFEKSRDMTDGIADKDFKALEDAYVRQGGTGAPDLFRLLQSGNSFSVLVSKRLITGNELISGAFFTVGGKTYCVTASVLQSYLLSTTKFSVNALYMRILAAGILLVSVVGIGYLIIRNYRNSVLIGKLTAENREKSILIQEQGDRLFTERDDSDFITTDMRTGLFSHDFFRITVEQLMARRAPNVGFISVRLDQLALLYGQYGYQRVTEIIHDAAQILAENLGENDIAARYGKAEFAAVVLRSNPEALSKLERKVAVQLAELDAKATFTCKSVFSVSGSGLAEAFETIRKEVGVL